MCRVLSGNIYFVFDCYNFSLYLSTNYYQNLKLYSKGHYLSCWFNFYSFLYLLNLLCYSVDLKCLYTSCEMGCSRCMSKKNSRVYSVRDSIQYIVLCLIHSSLKFYIYNIFHRRSLYHPCSIFRYCFCLERLKTFNLLNYNLFVT